MDALAALTDVDLFEPFFRGPSWRPWQAFLAVMTGTASKLPPDLLSLAQAATGREDIASCGEFSEDYAICGRRSGKSRIAAMIGVWTAVSRDWRSICAPGELATIAVIAADRAQARIVYRYCRELIRAVPMLKELVYSETATRMELSNGAAIEVFVASSVSVRGYSICCAILDEIAYWPSGDAADPDVEVLAALRPALATLPGSRLIAISSPYARRGELWDAYAGHFGRPGARKLVWVASTRTMNCTVSAETVAAALAEDPERAAAEWLAEFRVDCERLVTRDIVDAATVPGRHELPRCAGARYFAFCDPSGGSADSFTLAVAHSEGTRAVLDCIREVKPPFSPEQVVEDFATVIKSYGCNRVVSDKYGGVWVAEAFAKHAVICEQSADPKSTLYSNLLPGLNSSRVELLDVPRLAAQLIGLERKVSRSGKDSIDHGPGAHDDCINAAAGALTMALAKPRTKIDYAAQTFITQGSAAQATDTYGDWIGRAWDDFNDDDQITDWSNLW